MGDCSSWLDFFFSQVFLCLPRRQQIPHWASLGVKKMHCQYFKALYIPMVWPQLDCDRIFQSVPHKNKQTKNKRYVKVTQIFRMLENTPKVLKCLKLFNLKK